MNGATLRTVRSSVQLMFAAVVVLCVPLGVYATTLLRMNLAQIARAADTIVRAKCVGTSTRWDAGAIWTFAEIDVVETLKGSPSAQLIVRLPGGRVGNLVSHVEDAPRLSVGEEKVLFLERNSAGDYSVTGWVEGSFRIRKNAVGEETITQDSSEIAVFDTVTRQFHAEGLRNISISDFRQRLAVALGPARSGSR